jgi:hypothetical protein
MPLDPTTTLIIFMFISGIVLTGSGESFLALREMAHNSRASLPEGTPHGKSDYAGLLITGWLCIIIGVLSVVGSIVLCVVGK